MMYFYWQLRLCNVNRTNALKKLNCKQKPGQEILVKVFFEHAVRLYMDVRTLQLLINIHSQGWAFTHFSSESTLMSIICSSAAELSVYEEVCP